jgi:hypothetical protein
MATNDALSNFALYVAALRDTRGKQCKADPAAMLDDVIKRARAMVGMPPQEPEPRPTYPLEVIDAKDLAPAVAGTKDV